MFKKKVLTRNGINLTRNGAYAYRKIDFPTPPVLDILHFIYCANDFDGTKIPNKATNSDVGDYLMYGSLDKNGTGGDCYISPSSYGAYLYVGLTEAQRDLMRANDSTYTFFVRVQNSSSLGGILSWRSMKGSYGPGNNYNYMIRANSGKLQIHFNGGNDLGNNFTLESDAVFKIVVNGQNFYAKNFKNNAEWTGIDSQQKGMDTYMFSIAANCSNPGEITGSEYNLGKFFGVAGIARATTDEEDEAIKTYLMTQGV